MPSSASTYISRISYYIYAADPESILEIGPGCGKWGVLCREYLEVEKHRRLNKSDWKIRFDCIEVFEKYITPVHKYIYDNIYIGKAEDLILSLDNYDIILVIDVIEHMSKDIGLKFLKDCFEKASRVVIATPNGFVRQEAVFDNEFEIHRSGWTTKDFEQLGFNACEIFPLMSKGRTSIVSFWEKLKEEKND